MFEKMRETWKERSEIKGNKRRGESGRERRARSDSLCDEQVMVIRRE